MKIPKKILELNPEIETEVKNKGFYLYRWISFEQLRKTFTIDYLEIISKVLYFFGALVLLAGFYDYFFLEKLKYLLYVLVIGYSIIFFILIILMLIRSWYFLHISNVIFTDTHISIGGKIFKYEDYDKLEKDIDYYSIVFRKQFLKASKIKEKVAIFESKIFNWGAKKEQTKIKTKENSCSFLSNNSSSCNVGPDDCSSCDGDFGKVVIVGIILVFIYFVSIAIFYYIGFFVSFLLGFLFVGILKIILYFQNKQELKIQKMFEDLEEESILLKNSKEILLNNLVQAKDGLWEKGVNGLVKNFENLSGKIIYSVDLAFDLKKFLEKSSYKKIFNFDTYNIWVKKQILEPVNNIIELLDKYFDNLKKSIFELEKQIKKTDNEIYKAKLEVQLLRLKKLQKKFLLLQEQYKAIMKKISLKNF